VFIRVTAGKKTIHERVKNREGKYIPKKVVKKMIEREEKERQQGA